MFPCRAFSRGIGGMAFIQWFSAGHVLFCVPKENQKSTRYFRGAGGTNQGLLALDNPKAVGLHTKNPSRCAKGFFVLRRFEVACATSRADKFLLYLLRDSRRLTAARCRFPLRPLPVKKQTNRPRRAGLFAILKIFFPLKIARANAAAILNRFKMWYTVL